MDYSLALKDEEKSPLEGVEIWGGYTVLTPAYQNNQVLLTAKIIGGYTYRPYRPMYNRYNTDTIVSEFNDEDQSIFSDTTTGAVSITLPLPTRDNQQCTVISTGGDETTIIYNGTQEYQVKDLGVFFIANGGLWYTLGGAAQITIGGKYYNWKQVYDRIGAPGATIPNATSYGEGIFYVGVSFTYQGETKRTNGTFAFYDDGIDRYVIMATDVVGASSTLSLAYDATTNTLSTIATGSDFTALNLFGLYHWEEFSFGGYGAWKNTVEDPPFGEELKAGELFLDGTKDFTSSKGRKPVSVCCRL